MLSFAREKCVDCKICEEVCSFRLCDAIKPNVAAIQIGRDEGKWGTPFAKVCDLCKGLDGYECVDVCPEEALSFSDGIIVFDKEKCTECEECVDACPQNAVAFDSETGHIHICDLCGGKPLCIEWCPEDAISL